MKKLNKKMKSQLIKISLNHKPMKINFYYFNHPMILFISKK